MSNQTIDRDQWLKMRSSAKANKPNAIMRLQNMALTQDGQLCIGMTYNNELMRYTCTYLQISGVRDFGGSYSWDKQGLSLDGISNLDLSTIQDGVRKV